MYLNNKGGKFDQVSVNISNGDMVGQTGDIKATVVACKAADEAVKMILDTVEHRSCEEVQLTCSLTLISLTPGCLQHDHQLLHERLFPHATSHVHHGQ